MARFKNLDQVRYPGKPEVYTVQEVRESGDEPRYTIQLGSDFAARKWHVKESELELVKAADSGNTGPGFYPTKSIME